MSNKNIKAIGLLSGGLDSTLAVKIILDQRIDVLALNFYTGFCFTDPRRAASKSGRFEDSGGPAEALTTAAELGVSIELVDASQGYLKILHHPEYGYGKNVNPCIDCRIHMLSIARDKMVEQGSKFVFTGEVLGQRPKSQHLDQLKLIARRSGLEEQLLRPLSAQLLKPTLPEREGWIDRSKLFGFQGRSRKPQMRLVAKLGIKDYPTPAGGCCFLTDPSYGRKVHDLWKTNLKDDLDWEDYRLLKVGRHLRIRPDLKVIVGRNEEENQVLDRYRGSRLLLEVEDVPSPMVLIDEKSSSVNEEKQYIAARIAARYSDGRDCEHPLSVRIENGDKVRFIKVKPYSAEETARWIIA